MVRLPGKISVTDLIEISDKKWDMKKTENWMNISSIGSSYMKCTLDLQ